MATLIESPPSVQLLSVSDHRNTTPKTDLVAQNDDQFGDGSPDPYKHVNSDALVVLWFGQNHSSLRGTLDRNLTSEDVSMIPFSVEEQLWSWLNTNSCVTVASLLIQTESKIEYIASRSHAFNSIRSIIIRCETNQLISLQRFARTYVKIDGIFDDNTRLLIKLFVDLTLFSEEIGDQCREDEKNELRAQRNYDRALRLCVLARTF